MRSVQNKRESEGGGSGQERSAEEGGSDVAQKERLDLIKFLSALAQRTTVEEQDGADLY